MRAFHRDQFNRFASHFRIRGLDHHAVRDGHFRTDPKTEMIRLYAVCWKDTGWPPQPDQEFRAGGRQALAGPDVKGNALPAPGIDLEPQGRKRLCLRIGRDSLFRSISAKLPANNVVLTERRDRFQDFDLLIPDGLTVRPDGRLHRQVRQDLKQMILHYVADGAGLIVKSAAALDPEVFGHDNRSPLGHGFRRVKHFHTHGARHAA